MERMGWWCKVEEEVKHVESGVENRLLWRSLSRKMRVVRELWAAIPRYALFDKVYALIQVRPNPPLFSIYTVPY